MAPFPHLYVHLPFCRHKCGYCDFNAYARLDGLMEPYVEALERELGYAAGRYSLGPLATVYFGGGTPSLMPAESIRRILDRIRSLIGLQLDAEVTVEANPASTDPAKLAAWREAGVNRLSVGVQGFDPRALAVLERRTDGAQARRTVRQAREAGFANLSLDLIYAVPYQTVESWRSTLEQAIDLAPEHLSCSCLTVEEGTPLHRRLETGLLPAVTSAVHWEMMALCQSALPGADLPPSAVSTVSRPWSGSRTAPASWPGWPEVATGTSRRERSRSGRTCADQEVRRTIPGIAQHREN